MSLRELGWPTLLALVLALVCVLVTMLYDAPEGGFHLWPLVAVSVLVVSYAIWRTRRWALLLLVPLMLSPMWMLLLLTFACFAGDCL